MCIYIYIYIYIEIMETDRLRLRSEVDLRTCINTWTEHIDIYGKNLSLSLYIYMEIICINKWNEYIHVTMCIYIHIYI